MGTGVNARFDSQGFSGGGRLETYKAALRLIGDHPWFGTGQGTFADAFPAYRSSDAPISGVWDHAHNTLLEIAADMGVPIRGTRCHRLGDYFCLADTRGDGPQAWSRVPGRWVDGCPSGGIAFPGRLQPANSGLFHRRLGARGRWLGTVISK